MNKSRLPIVEDEAIIAMEIENQYITEEKLLKR